MIKLIDDKRVDMYKDGMRLIGEVKGEKAPPAAPPPPHAPRTPT